MAADPYLDYLARFEQKVGAVAVGSFGKFHGILERGDTINDAVVRMWRERRAELLIDGPEPGSQ